MVSEKTQNLKIQSGTMRNNHLAFDLEMQFRPVLELDDSKVILAMFVLYHLKKSGIEQVNKVEDIVSALPKKYATEISEVFTGCWQFFNLFLKRGEEEIRQALLDYEFSKGKENGFINTPEAIANLMLSIVDTGKDADVADYCCGHGQIMLSALKKGYCGKIYGVERDSLVALAAYARLCLLDDRVEIENRDVFSSNGAREKFDIILCNPPFNGIINENSEGYGVLQNICDLAETKPRRTASNWAFVYQILKDLKETGKAVCVLPAGAAFNKFDSDLRKYFIENGYIESLIMMPGNLFTYTSISVMLLVLSFHNSKIRMLDFSGEKTECRGKNYLTPDLIKKISTNLKRPNNECDVLDVQYEEIKKNNYDLNPIKYMRFQEQGEGRFLGEIGEFKRGLILSAEEQDKRLTKERTPYRFIRITDIQNGMLSDDEENMRYLDQCDVNEKFSLVNKRSVIISKIVQPLKIAVIEPSAEEQYVLGGSMYAIELKDSSINPYFLKGYLESKAGKKALLAVQSGRSIPAIAMAQLKEIFIPDLPLEKIQKISTDYEKTERKINDMEKQLVELRKYRDGIYDSVVKEGE